MEVLERGSPGHISRRESSTKDFKLYSVLRVLPEVSHPVCLPQIVVRTMSSDRGSRADG